MKRIIKYTQKNTSLKPILLEESEAICDRQSAISRAIITLTDSIKATAIVAETKSGATALKIAAQRPKQPIIVVTSSQRVAQQLAILYGCITFIRKDEPTQAAKLTNWLKTNRVLKKGDIIVTASGQHPGVVGTTDTIKVRALE
jgi:pyruvate kinase